MNNQPLAAETLLAALNWRYATKKFDATRKLTEAEWKPLEEALVLSPSSYGMQPYKFVVVTDPELKARLQPLAYGQSQIVDCSHLVVFASRTDITAEDVDHFIARTAEVKGVDASKLEGYRGMIAGDLVAGPRHAIIAQWTARQAYIALGNLMTSAALLGIDICPMEGFSPDGFNEVLGLPAQGYTAVVLAPVGFRSPEDKHAGETKIRMERERLIDNR
jgi:nitroreductase